LKKDGEGRRPLPGVSANLADGAEGFAKTQFIEIGYITVNDLAASFEVAVSADLPGAALDPQAHRLVIELAGQVSGLAIYGEGGTLELRTGIEGDGARGE
jgi:hypothetical protein